MLRVQQAGIEGAGETSVTRKHIRGSSLLLAGRLLSVSTNFATQLLMVRYLATKDYGALAYALVVVSSCRTFSSLGLNKAVSRFVPIYQEKRDYEKLFGTILLVLGLIAVSGLLFAAVVYALLAANPTFLVPEREPILLLSIMIFLVPLESIDELQLNIFAGLASPGAIFLRRHVLGPLLRFAVVLLLVLLHGEVVFVAYGYLLATGVGVLISCWVLLQVLRRQKLIEHLRFDSIIIPARELLAYTLPLLTGDLLAAVMQLGSVFLLGFFQGTEEVALFRVVLPAAQMNEVVMATFALLYTPSAARLFANKDYGGINRLYWETAVWMAVLSFPVFVLTFSVAQPLTIFLYGERYQQSGLILALLSLGYYFGVAFGFNALTLKVLGKVRYVVRINLITAVASIALNLLLIPRYGALGAAVSITATMILLNILNQRGLRAAFGLSIFERKHLPFYLTLGSGALALFFIQFFIANRIFVALALAALLSLIALAASKKRLNIGETFPELMRLPLMRSILA